MSGVVAEMYAPRRTSGKQSDRERDDLRNEYGQRGLANYDIVGGLAGRQMGRPVEVAFARGHFPNRIASDSADVKSDVSCQT